MPRTEKVSTTPEAASLVTRNELARLAGTSRASVRRAESAGTIRARRTVRGVAYFDPADARSLAAARARRGHPATLGEGEQAARAWETFEAGGGVVAAVLAHRMPPALAFALFDDWKRASAALAVGADALADLCALLDAPRLDSAAALVERVAALRTIARERSRRPPHHVQEEPAHSLEEEARQRPGGASAARAPVAGAVAAPARLAQPRGATASAQPGRARGRAATRGAK